MEELKYTDLQTILEDFKQDKSGTKHTLRNRVINLLSISSEHKVAVWNKIESIYKLRSISQEPSTESFHSCEYDPSIEIFLQNDAPNLPFLDNSLKPKPYLQPINQLQFENFPFFKTFLTVLKPTRCKDKDNSVTVKTYLWLDNKIRDLIVRSWDDVQKEYALKIVLRLDQIGLQGNATERLPYNLIVTVNGHPCELPALNDKDKCDTIEWRCNGPIDITKHLDLQNYNRNFIHMIWTKESHAYNFSIFMGKKLTIAKLLEDLKQRPFRASEKTKELITNSMKGDDDIAINSLCITLLDPLTRRRLKIPARGTYCTHLQCFDAIQFLEMNERKHKWTCPLCNIKVKFADIEIDSFYLDILNSPNLSEKCSQVILSQDGSWSEENNTEYSYTSKPEDIVDLSQHQQTEYNSSITNPEHVIETIDLTEMDDFNSTQNSSLLNPSFENISWPIRHSCMVKFKQYAKTFASKKLFYSSHPMPSRFIKETNDKRQENNNSQKNIVITLD